ncbi:MAG: hypothetical protein WBS19_19610 [Candidatus Korobacteraceae bacterium]
MRRQRPLQEEERDDFGLVEGATLTLLGLIIGFSFSMATTRYDQRKNYEEAEANAIGTEYVRVDLLPKGDAATIRKQLHRYTELRIGFYRTRRPDELDRINTETAALQTKMWEAVEAPSLAQPTPIAALAVAGMNDVLNSQGYTQAAWWNRIPSSAWALMIAIAMAGNFLVGYGARGARTKGFLLIVLPLVVAISFLLIADIDSPRGGFIHVVPQNLQSVLQSLPAE